MALNRAHTSAKGQQCPLITIIKRRVDIPSVAGMDMTRLSPGRNIVLPGATWNVSRNFNITPVPVPYWASFIPGGFRPLVGPFSPYPQIKPGIAPGH